MCLTGHTLRLYLWVHLSRFVQVSRSVQVYLWVHMVNMTHSTVGVYSHGAILYPYIYRYENDLCHSLSHGHAQPQATVLASRRTQARGSK